jgi:hypothetical protein
VNGTIGLAGRTIGVQPSTHSRSIAFGTLERTPNRIEVFSPRKTAGRHDSVCVEMEEALDGREILPRSQL